MPHACAKKVPQVIPKHWSSQSFNCTLFDSLPQQTKPSKPRTEKGKIVYNILDRPRAITPRRTTQKPTTQNIITKRTKVTTETTITTTETTTETTTKSTERPKKDTERPEKPQEKTTPKMKHSPKCFAKKSTPKTRRREQVLFSEFLMLSNSNSYVS